MRPCKNQTDEQREEIARQVADFLAAGKAVEHCEYCVRSEYVDVLERRADGTLTGKSNSRLFDK